MIRRPPRSTPFPTRRSSDLLEGQPNVLRIMIGEAAEKTVPGFDEEIAVIEANLDDMNPQIYRSEEHTSELQSLTNLVCRLLLEKKKNSGRPAKQNTLRMT